MPSSTTVQVRHKGGMKKIYRLFWTNSNTTGVYASIRVRSAVFIVVVALIIRLPIKFGELAHHTLAFFYNNTYKCYGANESSVTETNIL